MAQRFNLPIDQYGDANGIPFAGAKLEFYRTGTNTPLDTFADNGLDTANANPVVADAAGRFPNIFLQRRSYKVVLKTAGDVTIKTIDPVHGSTESDWYDVTQYGAAGDNSTDDLAAIQAAVNDCKAGGGGVVYFPPGIYRVSGQIDLTDANYVTLMGAATGASVIRTTSPSAAVIFVGTTNFTKYLTIKELQIDTAVARTGGWYVDLGKVVYGKFQDIRMLDYWNGFYAREFIQCWLERYDFKMRGYVLPNVESSSYSGPSGQATSVQMASTTATTNQGANFYLNNGKLIGAQGTGTDVEANWTRGLVIGTCEGVFGVGLDLQRHDVNTLITGAGAAAGSRNHHFTACYFDATFRGHAIILDAQTGSLITTCTWTGCWFASAGKLIGPPFTQTGRHNLLIRGAGAYGRLMWTGCRFFAPTGSNVVIQKAGDQFDGLFTGCFFELAGADVTGGTAWGFDSDTGYGFQGPTLASCKFIGNRDGGARYSSTSTLYSVIGFEADGNGNNNDQIFGGEPLMVSGVRSGSISEMINLASGTAVVSSELRLPQYGGAFQVTGTTGFSKIARSWPGRIVVLNFTGVLTITQGVNLKLGGVASRNTANFCTATFCCIDGENWFELNFNQPV